MPKVFELRYLNKLRSIGFEVFVSCVITRVGLGLFGPLDLALGLKLQEKTLCFF